MNLIESYRESFNTKGMSRKLEGRGSSLYQTANFMIQGELVMLPACSPHLAP
jgi:hypothetical protein